MSVSEQSPSIRHPAGRPRLSGHASDPSVTPERSTHPQQDTARAAVAHLYVTHRNTLVRLAALLVDDLSTAEDVVQDAFGSLHSRWWRLRDQNAAQAYLRIAVINLSRSVLRRRRTARLFTPPAHPDVPGADTAVLIAEEHRAVLAALKRLPRRQREVLALRYWSGLSEAEIAETLCIARGTVKSTTSRALAALTAMLDSADN
jgi:RNA polymerase sigma-70 factor (sigma-E family)